jgi:hypothetical protein
MAISKKIIVDQMEIVREKDHYILQVREATQFIENEKVVSQNFLRSSLHPNHDVSIISDPVVKAQFEAVMTDEVKQNYQTFLASQTENLSE